MDEPQFQYKLEVSNETPITCKPMKLNPSEEAWLEAYLEEQIAKGVIAPILPHENPPLVTQVLLVPQAQSG